MHALLSYVYAQPQPFHLFPRTAELRGVEVVADADDGAGQGRHRGLPPRARLLPPLAVPGGERGLDDVDEELDARLAVDAVGLVGALRVVGCGWDTGPSKGTEA